MKIRWYGHCSFLIQDSIGRRIFFDPINLNHAKDIINLNPKIVMLSHKYNNEISNYIKSNNILLIDEATTFQSDYLKLKGYSSFHDDVNGIKRGYNIIYQFTFDNLNLCYLGHLGHLLNDKLIDSLQNIDILFIPIGGHITIDGKTASLLINKLKPKVVIPMNYKTKDSLVYLDSIKEFIFSMKNYTVEKLNIFDSTLIKILIKTPKIILLNNLNKKDR